MNLEPGNYVKLIKPDFPKTIGQGPPPEGISISYPDKKYFLKYGTVFKLSEKVDEKYSVGDMDKKPYQVLNIKFVEEHKEQFKPVAALSSRKDESTKESDGEVIENKSKTKYKE